MNRQLFTRFPRAAFLRVGLTHRSIVNNSTCLRNTSLIQASYTHSQDSYLLFLQHLSQAALQGSPCPLASTPDCPALPTLEGAAAALGLLATACLPLHSRWRIEAHLGLTHRLVQQMQSQGDLRVTFWTLNGLRFMPCLDAKMGARPDSTQQAGTVVSQSLKGKTPTIKSA